MKNMKNSNNIGAFSAKKYIHKTWDGIFDFFKRYSGNLINVQNKTNPPLSDADILAIRDTNTAYGQLNEAIVETETLLESLRTLRIQLLTQKNLDPIHVPVIKYLIDLLAAIEGKRGGLLWQEDCLTDRVLRSPKCTQEDYDLLGLNYQPTLKPDPAKSIGRIYPTFTGGSVTVHWTLPRGLSDSRVSRSINHESPVVLYQGSENHLIDTHPVAHQAQVWAYTLEPLLHGQLYGKPITEKIIVGTDIAIEEEKI
ncbi:MAG: hypothetical protein LBK76_03795 [Verrucomicrobiales bacterium]|jgi:hypothetical protein|nr:hypothetical protein [Verrucomicrobiales bacterium]